MIPCLLLSALDAGKSRFIFGLVLLYLYAVLPTADAELSTYCTTFNNAPETITLHEGQNTHITIYTLTKECEDAACIAANTSCTVTCAGCAPFDGVVPMKIAGQGGNASAVPGLSCTIGKASSTVGNWPATCLLMNSISGGYGYILVLTIMDETNATLGTKSANISFVPDLRLVGTNDVPVPRASIDEAVNVLEKDDAVLALRGLSRKAPVRVLEQMSESLLNLIPSKAFSGHHRDSLQKIVETDIGKKNSQSVGTRDETPVAPPRTRQLLQFSPPPPSQSPPAPSPPDSPPPSQSPSASPAIAPSPVDEIQVGNVSINNATYDETLIPIINGPSQVIIQNVSVYLTGVLFNDFNILPPPGNPGTNASEYEVVLQVDSGSMLIYLPSELLPTVKHQVAVGNFWIAVPEDDWNLNPYQWVPGAGIQFQCTLEVCNWCLKTLSYGKGLGTGKKSKTIFTILVYPTEDGEAVAIAKAMRSCTMEITGAGAWFTIFQYTKLFYTTSLGVLGMGLAFLIMLCCILGCCVCWQNRKEKLFNKRQVIVKVEDALYDETRVFNPFWIPSAAVKADDNKFVITPNPKFLQQLQSEHVTRMQSVGKDGTLDAMQFLAAAQAAAATSEPHGNLTTSEEGRESGEETATETTSANGGSSLGSPSSGSSRSSRTTGTSGTSTSKSTSGTSRTSTSKSTRGTSRTSTSKSTRFSLRQRV